MAERNDEIDILELFAKVILTIRRNTKIIILAFVSGTILGLVYFQFAPRVYEGQMILQSDILTSSYVESMAESVNKLIRENNTAILSERLNMPKSDLASIAHIEIESDVKENVKKEKDVPETFIVTVHVVSKEILPKLQESIVNYLSNNEFNKIRVEQRRKYNNGVISKIDEQLAGLEQLKSKMMKGELISGGKENTVVFDLSSIYSKIVDMNKEKLILQNRLETLNSIQVVEGFTLFEKPVSPKLLLSLSSGASLGLFFVGAVIAFKVIRKMLNFSQEKLGQS